MLKGSVFHIDHTRTPKQLRIAGLLVLALGAICLAVGLFFLCMGSAFLAELLLYPVFPGLRPEAPADRFHAGALLFGSIVGIYGLLAASAGAYQTAFGKRAMPLVRIMIAIVVLLFVMGGVAALMMGDRVPGVV